MIRPLTLAAAINVCACGPTRKDGERCGHTIGELRGRQRLILLIDADPSPPDFLVQFASAVQEAKRLPPLLLIGCRLAQGRLLQSTPDLMG